MRACQKCAKKAVAGNRVSHSHHKEKRLFKPNLHRVTLVVNGVKQQLLVCSKCLKKLKAKREGIKNKYQVPNLKNQ